jgi:hypothetical protein
MTSLSLRRNESIYLLEIDYTSLGSPCLEVTIRISVDKADIGTKPIFSSVYEVSSDELVAFLERIGALFGNIFKLKGLALPFSLSGDGVEEDSIEPLFANVTSSFMDVFVWHLAQSRNQGYWIQMFLYYPEGLKQQVDVPQRMFVFQIEEQEAQRFSQELSAVVRRYDSLEHSD